MLDYFQRSGFTEAFEVLKREGNQESFVVDPKARYVGLLERKWTGVVRLQKRVSESSGSLKVAACLLPFSLDAIRFWN
jgi:platelet-activating factor acetylhydrolase IB subunit alpha